MILLLGKGLVLGMDAFMVQTLGAYQSYTRAPPGHNRVAEQCVRICSVGQILAGCPVPSLPRKGVSFGQMGFAQVETSAERRGIGTSFRAAQEPFVSSVMGLATMRSASR